MNALLPYRLREERNNLSVTLSDLAQLLHPIVSKVSFTVLFVGSVLLLWGLLYLQMTLTQRCPTSGLKHLSPLLITAAIIIFSLRPEIVLSRYVCASYITTWRLSSSIASYYTCYKDEMHFNHWGLKKQILWNNSLDIFPFENVGRDLESLWIYMMYALLNGVGIDELLRHMVMSSSL